LLQKRDFGKVSEEKIQKHFDKQWKYLTELPRALSVTVTVIRKGGFWPDGLYFPLYN
jgi:hypothetical protein